MKVKPDLLILRKYLNIKKSTAFLKTWLFILNYFVQTHGTLEKLQVNN